MHILVKFLKALNANEAPWQLSLALALALVPGLTPLLSLHNLAVLFLALFLRLHLGLFLSFALLFSGVAYLLDPLLDSLGYAILTAPALQPLFESWYQSSLMRLAAFNNTVVMGGLAASLAVGVPGFFLLNRLIRLYRGKLQVFVEKMPVIGGLRLFDFADDVTFPGGSK